MNIFAVISKGMQLRSEGKDSNSSEMKENLESFRLAMNEMDKYNRPPIGCEIEDCCNGEGPGDWQVPAGTKYYCIKHGNKLVYPNGKIKTY